MAHSGELPLEGALDLSKADIVIMMVIMMII